jgi:hypothetical protein
MLRQSRMGTIHALYCGNLGFVSQLDAGIMGSDPTPGMNVCVRLFCVCVVMCR